MTAPNLQDARLGYALAVEKLLGDARELQTHRDRLFQILAEPEETTGKLAPPSTDIEERPPCK